MYNKSKIFFKKKSDKILLAAITLDSLLNNESIAQFHGISESELSNPLLLKTATYLGTGIILLTLSHSLKKDNPTTGVISMVLGVGSSLIGAVYGLAYLYR